MPEREPLTRTLKASEARQQFSQLLNEVFRQEARVLVEKSGIPVAAIISAEDLKWLARMEEKRRKDFAILDETREAFKDVPDDELEREVAKALAAVRQKQRPVAKRSAKGKPTRANDPLWNIVGMARSEGPGDVSENVDQYLAKG